MDLDQVELTLLRAPDDPEGVCYEIEAKLVVRVPGKRPQSS